MAPLSGLVPPLLRAVLSVDFSFSSSPPSQRSTLTAVASRNDRSSCLFQVLCTLLEGEPPGENSGSAPPPTTEKENDNSGDGDIGGDGSTGGGESGSGGGESGSSGVERRSGGVESGSGGVESGSDGVENGSGGGESGRGGSGGDGGEGSGRLSSGSDGNEEGGGSEGDGKPEKSRFNVLLGMLTIATMVDAEGKAAASWAAKSAAGWGQADQEVDGQAERGRMDINVCFFGNTPSTALVHV